MIGPRAQLGRLRGDVLFPLRHFGAMSDRSDQQSEQDDELERQQVVVPPQVLLLLQITAVIIQLT